MQERECPFCPNQLALTQDRILYREKNVVVILSDPRLMEGHTLVIPTRHVSALSELRVRERTDLFEAAMRFQEKLKKFFPNGGCDMSQHDRPFMPKTRESVPEHLHIHLRPRIWNDEYYQRVLKHETDMFKSLSSEERDSLRKILME